MATILTSSSRSSAASASRGRLNHLFSFPLLSSSSSPSSALLSSSALSLSSPTSDLSSPSPTTASSASSLSVLSSSSSFSSVHFSSWTENGQKRQERVEATGRVRMIRTQVSSAASSSAISLVPSSASLSPFDASSLTSSPSASSLTSLPSASSTLSSTPLSSTPLSSTPLSSTSLSSTPLLAAQLSPIPSWSSLSSSPSFSSYLSSQAASRSSSSPLSLSSSAPKEKEYLDHLKSDDDGDGAGRGALLPDLSASLFDHRLSILLFCPLPLSRSSPTLSLTRYHGQLKHRLHQSQDFHHLDLHLHGFHTYSLPLARPNSSSLALLPRPSSTAQPSSSSSLRASSSTRLSSLSLPQQSPTSLSLRASALSSSIPSSTSSSLRSLLPSQSTSFTSLLSLPSTSATSIKSSTSSSPTSLISSSSSSLTSLVPSPSSSLTPLQSSATSKSLLSSRCFGSSLCDAQARAGGGKDVSGDAVMPIGAYKRIPKGKDNHLRVEDEARASGTVSCMHATEKAHKTDSDSNTDDGSAEAAGRSPSDVMAPLHLNRILILDKVTRYESELGSGRSPEEVKEIFPGAYRTHILHTYAVKTLQQCLEDTYGVHTTTLKAQSMECKALQKEGAAFPPDAIFSAGGDGTFLEAASLVPPCAPGSKGMWLLGINTDLERSAGYLCLRPSNESANPESDDEVDGEVDAFLGGGKKRRSATHVACDDSNGSPPASIPAVEAVKVIAGSRPLSALKMAKAVDAAINSSLGSSVESDKTGHSPPQLNTAPESPSASLSLSEGLKHTLVDDSDDDGLKDELRKVNKRIKAHLRKLLVTGGHQFVKRQRIRVYLRGSDGNLHLHNHRAVNDIMVAEKDYARTLYAKVEVEPYYWASEPATESHTQSAETCRTHHDDHTHTADRTHTADHTRHGGGEIVQSHSSRGGSNASNELNRGSVDDYHRGDSDTDEVESSDPYLLTSPSLETSAKTEECQSVRPLVEVGNDVETLLLKSSGVLLATGTGSSAWTFNICKVNEQTLRASIEAFIASQPQEVRESLVMPSMTAMCAHVNSRILFSPSLPAMRYVIREPIENRVFTLRNATGFTPRVVLTPLSQDAYLKVDGLLSTHLEAGQQVVIEMCPRDAIYTAI